MPHDDARPVAAGVLAVVSGRDAEELATRGVLVASEDREVPKGVTIVYSFRSLFRLIREEAKL